MGEKTYTTHAGAWWRKPEGKKPLGRPGLDGSIILKWLCKK
jgi:hypothetical protein